MPEIAEVFYLSYNGIDEPLVQSQVLPYLKRLAQDDWSFRLLTFERNTAPVNGARPALEGFVDWIPIKQLPGPLGRAWAVIKAFAAVRRLIRQGQVQLVHARSYVPAMVAMAACRGSGVPWLFDMRGLWVDEKVLKGTLREGSLTHSLLKRIECTLIRSASGIVSLTHRALPRIMQLGCLEERPPHAVIPTCVDVERFSPGLNRRTEPGRYTFGYIGSLGAGYATAHMVRFLGVALEALPRSRALIVTQSSDGPVSGLKHRFGTRVQIRCGNFEDMPQLIRQMDMGLSYITPHSSKDGSFPTKIGEYLASGVFVISNAGIGDLDDLLENSEVGVIAREEEDPEVTLNRALEALADPAAPMRCRAFAKSHLGVREGARRYHGLYGQMVSQSPKRRGIPGS